MASDNPSMGNLTTADGRRPRVAIVGGTPAGTMVAIMLAEQFGCAPLPAPTGAAVLSLLARDSGIDLVVIDLAAPGTEMIVAAEMVRAAGARGGLPVIALTESHSDRRYPHALAKPYSPRELYGAMREALARPVAAPVPHHA